MYLRSLTLENFRSCANVSIEFDTDLTVLAGENNSGKSTVLDGIRLLTLPLDDRRELFARPEDARKGGGSDSFSVSGEFCELTPAQIGLNVSALGSLAGDRLRYGFQYEPPKKGRRYGRPVFWAGVPGAGDPEPEARRLIRHVYLPALRDAQRELASSSADRIALIVRHLAGSEKVSALELSAKKAFEGVEGHAAITETNAAIQEGLTLLTEGVSAQGTSLGFTATRLERLARDLRFRLADAGVDPGELSESGLGYANLLYMATILAELEAANEADLTLLLVEEPEAHLHPQLQLAAVRYLGDCAARSRKEKRLTGEPAGHVQVIVTTHSPNITAAVSLKNTVILTTRAETAPGPEAPSTDTPPVTSTRMRSAVALPIRRLDLPPKVVQKLDRYLDVTRSSLLFSRRALLIEGISEAILLKVLAHHYVLRPVTAADEDASKSDDGGSVGRTAARQRLARFDATCIIPIEGVDFEPYLRLLLGTVEGQRLGDRVVVVTDEDPNVRGDRRTKLEAVATSLGAEAGLSVFVGDPTLEGALMGGANDAVLREAFLACHPRLGDRWDKEVGEVAESVRPAAVVELLKETRTSKGEFALRLADVLAAEPTFVVPDYLRRAIERISEP